MLAALLTLTGLLVSVGASNAAATTDPPPNMAPVQEKIAYLHANPDVFEQAVREFEQTELPRVRSAKGGIEVNTYTLPRGLHLTLPTTRQLARWQDTGSSEPQPGEVTPAISAGRTKYGYWIGFNTTDQSILASGIGGTAIAAAICAIPFVGWAACFVASVAVAVATGYLLKNGICSGGRTLYWYDMRGGSTIQCRSTKPNPA